MDGRIFGSIICADLCSRALSLDVRLRTTNCWISRSVVLFCFVVIEQKVVDSISFSLGLATTLALLGIAASLAGKAYGQVGQGLPVAVSIFAMIMGMNLLEVLCFVNP